MAYWSVVFETPCIYIFSVQDTQWNDLDYMNNSNDITYDREQYKGLPEFVDGLHKRGMHYIPLVDPGVSAGEKIGSYWPYDIGIAMNIFVKNASGMPFIGKVSR